MALCRPAELGGHVDVCRSCDFERPAYNNERFSADPANLTPGLQAVVAPVGEESLIVEATFVEAQKG